jgi:glycosyltransferase involved in cell wall biosynthesis
MSRKAQSRTCILTIQADRPGGIPTVIDWWYAFLTGWGHQATALYAPYEPHLADYTLWQRLALTVRTWRVHPRPDHPVPTLANAPPPVPIWLVYFMPQWLFGSVLSRFDQIVVAGGPCLVGVPLALRRQPFILWMGTLYEDELRGKAVTGNGWAARTLRSPFWPFLAWQERFVLRRAARILSQSPYTQRRILEVIPEVRGRLDLVMAPIDTEVYHPLPPAERHPQQRYILSVCRVNDPRKNIPMLLAAFSKVLAHLSDLKLVLAGDDPDQSLLDDCERLGITQSVEFRGKVSQENLVALYQRAELFVIASAQEGLGIVMLEAMACGLPVVATDCGGPEGIVVDGETGRLVPNNDPDTLAAAIIELLDCPDYLESMREWCVAFIHKHCTRSVVERKLYEHFVSVFPDSEAARRDLIGTL